MYKGVPKLTINTPSSIARNIGQCNIQGNREASLAGGCGQQIYLIRKQLPEILKLLKQTSAIHFVNLTVWPIIHNFHFYMIIMAFSNSFVKSVYRDGQGYNYPRPHHGCRRRSRKFSNFDASSSLENTLL